jgi:MFS family permease
MADTGSRSVLITLFLGVLMAALDIAILGPAIPAIRETFTLDERQAAWILNAFVLLNLVGVPLMSKLADVSGRRRIFLIDIGLFALGGLVVSVSPNFSVLLVGRGLQGLAASGIFPVAAAMVGDTFPPHRRGRTLGILGAVFGLAFIIGPIFAGVVLLAGWRWLYASYLPVALFVGLLAFRTLPKTARTTAHPFDRMGVILLAGILLALAYGITWINADSLISSLTDPRVFLSFLITAALIPFFLRQERRAADPIIHLEIFRNRQIALTSILSVGAGLNEAAFIFFPTMAILAFGVSMSTASFMLLPLVFAVAIGSPIGGWVLDRKGSRFLIVVSNIMLVVGMAGFGMAPLSEPVFYTGSILIGLGLAGVMGSGLSYILLHESTQADRTVSQGLITLFISIGQIVGGATVGAIAVSKGGTAEGYGVAFVGIAAVTVVLTILSFRLKSAQEEAS